MAGDGSFSPASGGLQVRLLGGVDVMVGSDRVAIGGAKPRALLAVLALQPATPVSVDRLVDAVWGDAAPPTVRSSVQVHVSNLRRALAAAGAAPLVETRGSGYAFTADPDVVDVHRFGAWARSARAAFAGGDLEAASMNAREARTLWRGTPLAGVGDAPFAAGHVAAWEDEFLSLIELYADIEIALGRPGDVVGELEHIVAAHPYRETAWSRLSLALFRCGRQVDALARLRTVRHLLAEDLGLDPSPELSALEIAILNHDPALRGPDVAVPTVGDTLPPDSRLPAARTLVGRDGLVDAVVAAVGTHRLVTVIGPGGVGKTSLAVAAAGVVSVGGTTSARFVDLAALDSSAGLLPSVLAAVGARSDDAGSDIDALVTALDAYASSLLVLDNCEHVIDDVARLAVDLLDRCRELRLLATSRVALAVPAEATVACPPLSDEAAVDLFVARAQSADREWVATDGERVAIAGLVERLDGLPLAIELFAARVQSLSAADMLVRFDDEVMTTAWRSTSAPRHRSLHDVVAWSYALLDDEARRCLRRLSVFGGSVGADAISVVCRLERRSVLDQLVASSLVVAERTGIGVRYRLLATVRAFAAAELARDDDCEQVRWRLVDWVTDWAASVASAVAGPDPAVAVDELDAAAPNIRVAYDIARERPGAAAHLLAAFGPMALGCSLALPEAVSWAGDAAADPAAADHDRMVLSILIARLTNVGTVERKDRLRSAIETAERLGDDVALAAAWSELALASTDVAEEGLAVAMRAIAIAERVRQPVTLAWGLNIALTELLRLRRFDEAVDLYDRYCVAGTSRFGIHEGHVLFQTGRLAMLRGDLDAAMHRFLAAEQAALRTRSVSAQSTAWFGRAEVERRSNDVAAAYALYRRCLPVDLVAEPGETGLVRMMIVWTACLLGEIDVAEHHARVLADECAHEVAEAEDTTMHEACSVGADGLLALAKGMRSVAGPLLRRALVLWASSDSWDVVADLIERLPELGDDEVEAAAMRDLAEAVRDGSVSQEEALRRVGA